MLKNKPRNTRKDTEESSCLPCLSVYSVVKSLHEDSELVTFLWTIFGQGHDLRAVVGHQDCVFELSGQLAVESPHGPTVELVEDRLPGSQIQHRFDREAHARADDLGAGFAASEPEVRHAGFLVKAAADAVALVVSHDFEFTLGRIFVNGSADVADLAVRLDGSDADPQRFERRLDQAFCIVGNFADQERFRLVTVPAVDDRRQVDVDNVAVFQFVLIWNSVTDDFVDADTTDVGVRRCSRRTRITQTRWRVTVIPRVLFQHFVEINCPRSGLDVRTDEVHQLGVETAGGAKVVSFFSVVNRWLPAQRMTPVLTAQKDEGSAQLLEAIMPKTKRTRKSRLVIAIGQAEEKLLDLTVLPPDGQWLLTSGLPNE